MSAIGERWVMIIKSRHIRRIGLAAGIAAMALAGTAIGANAPARVEDFALNDQEFLHHRLYKMSDAKAIVLIAYQSGDAAIRADAAAYAALQRDFAGKGVEMMMIASKVGETRDVVNAEAKALGLTMPILFDYQQLTGEGLNLTRAAEVIVVDPKTWTVAYRGTPANARKAVEGLVAGQKVSMAADAPKGGVIAFPERGKARAHAAISYSQEIAPIIRDKCATCHQPGGVAPMALNNYEQVKGFAPMIRESIRTQRMPPYFADQTVGKFEHDDRLTPAQIKTLVHWIEAGAPRGKGEDTLAKVKFQATDWPLGKPDVIVEIPAFPIPASGVIDYQNPRVPTNMTEGRWMRATTFKISDRQVVHHILTTLLAPGRNATVAGSSGLDSTSIGGYGPGRLSNLAPPNTGVWIPPGGSVAFQNHYTPYGKATVEQTQMGIYFYPKGQEPKYPMRTFGMFDFGITIPAGAERHKEMAYIDIPKDAVIYAFTPHAHTRGASANVSVLWPNGKEEMLFALPKYDFNWQYQYDLATPLKVPAGSRIITRWTYDNSTRNKANPDPKKDVTWGEQTWQEMLALYFHYSWDGETTAAPRTDYDALLQGGLMMGVLDDNMDGKLQQVELRGTQGAPIKANFALIDGNKDGALDKTELAAAQAMLRRGRGGAAPAVPATPAAAPRPVASN